ncbi:Hypp1386 [Branchiostoma lanceolatum]|uniref:Hypp1386 protein n=1 Tax=Branchiostoma lanceolatum TaxID=7740 RepID=A0A8K0EIL9_BRALA|nr:Hypp1386 [Branchiostoma lanceolatum]
MFRTILPSSRVKRCPPLVAPDGKTFDLLQKISAQTLFWNMCRQKHYRLPQQTPDPFLPIASEVLDVRTPAEFAEDHVPGARNLPVLSNQERVKVGTLYNEDRFAARKLGAALISANIGSMIQDDLIDKPKDYSPLVYCWRGGQRSGSLGIILSQIGFKVYLLEGGYRTYRQTVARDLQELPAKFKFLMLSGMTGVGKTYLLHRLQEQGEQVLDLEGAARHKGSILGLWAGETQPSQKAFESSLRNSLAQFNPSRPVWLESESSKVGRLHIPAHLFEQMKAAHRIELHVPISWRIQQILRDYPHLTQDTAHLKELLQNLRKFHGGKKLDSWFCFIDNGRWEEFVESILREHYDPAYSKSVMRNSHGGLDVTTLQVDSMDGNYVQRTLLAELLSLGNRLQS